MKLSEVRENFLQFFEGKNHKRISSSSVVSEDETVLFTTAGMQPLTPYLKGKKHLKGKRLVNSQKCVRTLDIDEVGDESHLTIFEMLGNWSLGDYFKKEAINWSYEFLTNVLKISKNRLAFTVFKGNSKIPFDDESEKIWLSLGINQKRIKRLGKEDNFWGPVTKTGICGPDTEIFYWNSEEKIPEEFNPADETWLEVWNNVFIEYDKKENGNYELLAQKNVDAGMGLERISLVMQGVNNVFEVDSFKKIIIKIKKVINLNQLNEEELKSVRIIADHIRTSVFMLGDEKPTFPKNVGRGYILRRLIRRTVRHLKILNKNFESEDLKLVGEQIIKEYGNTYPELIKNEEKIFSELNNEVEKFSKTLKFGLKKLDKISKKEGKITANNASLLFQSFGFPIELIKEICDEKGIELDFEGFKKLEKQHQEKSKKAKQKFKK